MIDISCELSESINNGSLQKLIKKYNADPTLDYSVSNKLSASADSFSVSV